MIIVGYDHCDLGGFKLRLEGPVLWYAIACSTRLGPEHSSKGRAEIWIQIIAVTHQLRTPSFIVDEGTTVVFLRFWEATHLIMP